MSISVRLASLPSERELETLWRELESRADTTFFTTWSWIGAWQAILPERLRPCLLMAYDGQRLVGLGVVVQGTSPLLRAIPVKCWYLHATGNDELDNLTIEYNGFLVDRSEAIQARAAMLKFLLYQTGTKRLELPCAQGEYAALARSMQKDVLVRARPLTAHMVDLNKARSSKDGYLGLISANTRSQIRRSMRAYSQLGPVTVEAAQNVAQAMKFMAALRRYHGETWDKRGRPSAFAHVESSIRFHDSLIENCLDKGEIQVLRVAAGDTDIGYVYSMVYRGRVLYYQSGLNYGLLDKLDKPGMVSHYMAIEHNVQAGHGVYDFAAGDYRYKVSMSTDTEPMGSYVFQRDGWLPRLDAQLRLWKQAWRNLRAQGLTTASIELAALLPGTAEMGDWLDMLPI